jgi:hypothetical protein
MNKDWFPFFSMLFWVMTKIVGLFLAVFALNALGGMLGRGFEFSTFLFLVIVPLGIAFVLLVTEIVFDVATAEMRRRQSVAK